MEDMKQTLILRKWTDISKCVLLGAALMFAGCKGGTADAGADGKWESSAKLCDPGEYDLSCMKDDKTATSDGVLDVLGGIKDEVVNMAGEPVSDERQDEYGDNSRAEIERQFPVMEGHPKQNLLNGLLHKLLKLRRDPSGIKYNIYIVQSDMVNAFTLGGEIYVTNTLLDEAGSTDELACIIGHEIGHNELGHVGKKLKEVEIAQGIFGDEAGEAVAGFVGLLTMGFNQKNEAESDLYGIDLALGGGYDACRGIDFWDRLKSNEGEANDFENMFRSHPYSARRAECYRSHLRTEHEVGCD